MVSSYIRAYSSSKEVMQPKAKVALAGVGLLTLFILGRRSTSRPRSPTSSSATLVETEPLIHTPENSPRKLPGRIKIAKRPTSIAPTQDVLRLTNEFRSRGGICGSQRFGPTGPLQWDDKLATSAMRHAQDMASKGYFEHISPSGSTPEQRIHDAGWTIYPIGENIAAGQETPDEVVQSWIKSPGHCRNLLDPKYHHIGIAYYFAPNSQYKHYWVQNFGG